MTHEFHSFQAKFTEVLSYVAHCTKQHTISFATVIVLPNFTFIREATRYRGFTLENYTLIIL